jgi:hypothetical protein
LGSEFPDWSTLFFSSVVPSTFISQLQFGRSDPMKCWHRLFQDRKN